MDFGIQHFFTAAARRQADADCFKMVGSSRLNHDLYQIDEVFPFGILGDIAGSNTQLHLTIW
jgi:hypothetical protein